MNWIHFIYLAIPAWLCWLAASVLAFARPEIKKTILGLSITGLLIFAIFIGGFWIHAGRFPLTTTGETRLWYIFFLMICGLGVYLRYRYRWVLGMSTLLSGIFILLNILKPDLIAEPMMPVLRSFWFVPHVIVYIFAYGILGVAFLLSLWYLCGQGNSQQKEEIPLRIDSLTRLGLGFLTLGACLGAIWAERAWGYYWTWDPKETWALISILVYGVYLCLRHSRQEFPVFDRKWVLWIQILGFICLQVCWYGVHYLKAAQGLSIHIYG